MAAVTPFVEDTAICQVAEAHGLRVQRMGGIKITDAAAIRAAGLVRETPDYAAIRRRLEAGQTVEGAQLGEIEYFLRRMEEAHE